MKVPASIQRNEWFTRLGADLQSEFVRRSVTRHYAPGTLIYATGSAPNGYHIVLRGEVRLEHYAKSGKIAFYQSLRPGDGFGLLSELDRSPRFSDARSWGDTSVMQLPHEALQDLYRRDPQAREAFVALICANLHTTLGMLVESHSAPPRAQIASILVATSSRNADDPRGQPKLTHEAVAALAGVSRPTASKVLHELRDLGLIALQYGKVSVLDLAGLQKIGAA